MSKDLKVVPKGKPIKKRRIIIELSVTVFYPNLTKLIFIFITIFNEAKFRPLLNFPILKSQGDLMPTLASLITPTTTTGYCSG